jgi:hypothetical protein
MKKLITAALLLVGLLSGNVHALDLTPHEIASSGDGPLAQRYFFQDGGKRITFSIASSMTVSGSSDATSFGFNDVKTGSVKLSKSRMNPELPFDEKNLELYRAAARMLLPPEAKDVLLAGEKPNAISMNGWTSHQFDFTYSLFGFPYRRSVTFLNYSEKEQIIFDVSAPAPDYEKSYARGYRVLNSLSDLPADRTSGPT